MRIRFKCFIAWLTLGFPAAVAAPRPPARIASCAIAADEVLVDLLTRTGQLTRLVAVSTLADDPRYSNLVPVPKAVTGRCGGELESLLKLKPDVAVVASFNRPELIARLKNAGVQVHRLGDFESLADVESNLRALGKLIDAPTATAAVLAEFKRGLERMQGSRDEAKAGSPVRAMEYFPDGVISGKQTLFDAMVRHAGGRNVGAELGLKGWPRLGAEVMATLRPDVLFASGEPGERDALLARLRSLPLYKDMPAVKHGHVVLIPQREMSAASPHLLKALARIQQGLKAARKARP